ncbi:MAG TPA: hypothetical protein VEV83_11050 [Parafilimonas sp.]|nr:hypothetical protein [Parafilimonas sp.]
MGYAKFIVAIFFLLCACKKEEAVRRLSFSEQERSWFIYHVGQQFKFKSAIGDSIIFLVDSVIDYFHPEYKYPDTTVVIDEAETYVAHLTAADDFINIAFYKSSLYLSDASELNETIAWHDVTGQFVEIDAIKSETPFTVKTLNGVTYDKVSAAVPMSDVLYPWTRWESAYYDQKSGFIELIDTSGASWIRQ